MTRSRLIRRRYVVALFLAVGLLGAAALWTNTLGVRDRASHLAHRIELFVDPPPPPPDRPIAGTVLVTPRPFEEATPAPSVTAGSSAPGATPGPTKTAAPQRAKVDVNLLKNPAAHFITEIDHEWCAVSGTQIVLALNGKAPLTEAFQSKLASQIDQWESRRDSLNGGWGPSAMVAALDAYGVPGYEVRGYQTRQDALFDAAKAVEKLHAPVLLMAWRGAHTWVMTGFRADADPLQFSDARIAGTYILDPWYPRVSSIWGPSDPPGTYQNNDEMVRNYLRWKRPEGHYPDRDGLFIAIVPTKALNR